MPGETELPQRLRAVLAVVYLIFNEGYTALREELCTEAIRLGRLLVELIPEDSEVQGLLALMLLSDSRRAARRSPEGEIVLLADQDRSRWNRDFIAEGQAIVRRCLQRNQPGPYQIQAAINAVHSNAPDTAATDWKQILQLYNHLMAIAPTSVAALNRAVALAEVQGPEVALQVLDELKLDAFYLFHAIRADLLRRLARHGEAALAYDAAIERCEHAAERQFLERRRRALCL